MTRLKKVKDIVGEPDVVINTDWNRGSLIEVNLYGAAIRICIRPNWTTGSGVVLYSLEERPEQLIATK